jgi:hypothetical protein
VVVVRRQAVGGQIQLKSSITAPRVSTFLVVLANWLAHYCIGLPNKCGSPTWRMPM